MSRYLVPVYTITIFLSAFLLFVFQPMVGKYLLPLLGGSPSVWNTAMLFFQLLLLAGYIYAHLLTKIRDPRIQAGCHLVLMALAAFTLPLAIPSHTEVSTGQPIWWQLRTMVGMAAAPFFILSASAPLLQKWFSQTDHKAAHNPYFLYSASNVGSMLALLSYPVVTEPLLGLHQQSILWMFGYIALSVLFIICAYRTKFYLSEAVEVKQEPVNWSRRFSWVFLAFCPSSLMLGYTSYITTDVASMPLLWVIPLALYLGTFIIAFSPQTIIPLKLTRILQGILLLFFVVIASRLHAQFQYALLIFNGFLFFFTALMCHQELVAKKPGTSRLTEFYLFISIGGALGGIFNSLIAPVIFKYPIEYFLVLILSVFARYSSVSYSQEIQEKYKWYQYFAFPGVILLYCSLIFLDKGWVPAFGCLLVFLGGLFLLKKRTPFLITMVAIGIMAMLNIWSGLRTFVLVERNFFGVLHISDDTENGVRLLSNGTTTHGAQALDPRLEKIPLTYYYKLGGAGDVFSVLGGMKYPQRVAAMGLGVGSISCYSHPDRNFEFYEINKAVVDISTNAKYFSYLQDCGSPVTIIMGDARQKIAKALDHNYNLIFVDVFSSDNIPMHIITLDAMKIYKQKLAPGGMIVFHISNRFFDLRKEVAVIGKGVGMTALYQAKDKGKVDGTAISYYPSIYVALSENDSVLQSFKARGWKNITVPEGMKPWTDDYANIIRAFKRN